MKQSTTRKALIIFICILSLGTYAQMPNTLSKSEKVYGLSKFWQEVNYNFVYLNKVDRKKWDATYKELIDQVQLTKNDYEYYRLLEKFCAMLKDGHTNVYYPQEVQKNIYTTYFGDYRLFLTEIDGKAIVTRVNLSKKDEIPIGTEIIRVNRIATKSHIEKNVLPYIASSTDHILMKWGVSRMLRAPKGTSFDLTLKLPNGKIKEVRVTHEETTEKEVFPEFEKFNLFDFKWIDKEIAYISLNTFGNPKIDSLFLAKLPELYKAKKLIIDLRKNGGGNTSIAVSIFKYLTNDTLLYGSKNQSRLHIPSFKAWGKYTEAKDTVNNGWATQSYLSYHDNYFHKFDYNPRQNRLKSARIVLPTAILIGNNTASAAEDFLIYADNQKHMTKIGEPTFGSTGQPFQFEMPGGGSARICTKKDTYSDGREFVGYGVQPDITMKKSYKDYMSDNDPVLKKAIKFLKTQ